jgi:hypothetical protein
MASKPLLPPRDVTDKPGATSANDALVDLFMERAIDLLRLEAGTRNYVFALLNDLEREIIVSLVKADPTGPARTAYQRARLEKLLQIVTASIRASYRSANVFLGREIRELIDIEATWTGNAINSAIQVDFATVGVTRNFLEAISTDTFLIQGASSRDWWSRQAAGLANRFADEMRRGMALGETNAQLVARVRGPEGMMRVARTSAERLVRASVQSAANAGREATYSQNLDLISALQWSATLDTRTSVYCITRDHHKYSPDSEHRPLDKGPPWLEGPGKLHWGCRSTSVPVLKSWRELGIDEDDVPETTRASMDGQVPVQTSFESWLKQQSAARQNTVLGEGKADLWRRGKIGFRDLLDQDGRPLTTDELRAKAARR